MFLGEEEGQTGKHRTRRTTGATGAPTVAAACPFCNSMFRDALTQISNAGPAQAARYRADRRRKAGASG